MFIGIGLGLGLEPHVPYPADHQFPILTVSGGTITPFTRNGVDYVEVLFTASGSFEVSADVPWSKMDLRGGAGSGGADNTSMGSTETIAPSGGAAGGRRYREDALPSGSYTLVVGAGGAPAIATAGGRSHGNAGSSSTLNLPGAALTAPGGPAGRSSGGTDGAGVAGETGSGGAGGWGATASFPGGIGSDGGDGGDGYKSASTSETLVLARGGGGGGGIEGDGGDASAGLGGAGGTGTLVDWIATPRRLGSGGGGAGTVPGAAGGPDASAGTNTGASLNATMSSGSGGARRGASSGKGGDGFLFLVVRADQVNVVAA